MARRERGIYEPSEEVRVFDGAEDDEDDAEGSRLPLLIVLALVVLCAFGGVVWLAYTQGVSRGRTETPVLAAAPGPERIAPQTPGGTEVPYQGFKIYEQPAPTDEGDTPAPVTPPQAAAQAAPAPAPVAKPGPAPTPPPATRPAATPAAPPPVATAKPVPAPVRQAAAPAPTPAPAATGAPRSLPGPAATTPAPAPARPAATVAAATPAPATAKPAAAGGTVLQIGAFKSQAEADAAWRTYRARHAALLSGYGPNVQQVDLGEKGTWYRLRIAGFADRDVASALCDRLKADSGACILGR